jgi:NTE family protein
MATSADVTRGILAAVSAFDGLTPADLEALAVGAKARELRRGEALVRPGEAADELYFVVSGRFAVHTGRIQDSIAEIGPGHPIGEIGFFANIPRTATVTALRDSQVLAITRERFEQIEASSPRIRDAVIKSLASRLAETTRLVKQPAMPRTMAILLAGQSRQSQRFTELLRAVFCAQNRALFLTHDLIETRFPGFSLHDPSTSSWLNSLETEADFIFYIADDVLTDWTKKCIRQADIVLLIAVAGSGVEPNPSEHFAFALHEPAARRLVILHEARTAVASGTASWFRGRDIFMHHHVALQDKTDVRRLYRFLSGQAVGFVAGGGGALGSAHLGVYKAFTEMGADFDILGGTSTGAAMMAFIAAGKEPEEVDQITHDAFVNKRALKRWTLPYYSLLNHKVYDRQLRAELRGTMIEDFWLPYFAISVSLSKNTIVLHRRGLAWHAIRASTAIPGILPPFFTKEGEMLVDGGIVDNVPLAAMKELKAGPNLVVTLTTWAPKNYPIDYDQIPGPAGLIVAAISGFFGRRPPRAPDMMEVITLSLKVNRRQGLPLGRTDMVIQPEIPVNLHWLSWDRHTELLIAAYRGGISTIRERMAQKDACLMSIIDASNIPDAADGLRASGPAKERAAAGKH